MGPELVLIRGLPGSGKTSIAKVLVSLDKSAVRYLEADMYFTDLKGRYIFEREKLPDAHHWCQTMAKSFASDLRLSLLIVSNTFSQLWEMEPYFRIKTPHVFVAKGEFPNVHGVPEEMINLMKNRWEPFPSEREIPRGLSPWDSAVWVLDTLVDKELENA